MDEQITLGNETIYRKQGVLYYAFKMNDHEECYRLKNLCKDMQNIHLPRPYQKKRDYLMTFYLIRDIVKFSGKKVERPFFIKLENV